MSASPAPSLPSLAGPPETARLRAVAATSPRAGAVVATSAYRLASVVVPGAALVVPLAGTKRVRLGERPVVCPAGAALVIADQVALDVENLPDERGAYLALTLALPARVRASVSALLEGPVPAADEPIGVCPLPALEAALVAFFALPAEADPLVVDHALAGVVVALVGAGAGRMLAPREPGLADRIREMAGAAPARPWAAEDFERALHVSGATLRRRLAAEGTSVRRLLVDVRLHHGLALLQTTRAPLKAVAYASGYRSLASFREQFRARFGCEPSLVRADPRRST